MALQLPADFSDFLSLLNAHRVDYLLVGGYAVSIHGYVRATGDMDLFIAPTRENAERVVSVIREFGFDVPGLSADQVLEPRKILRMGSPPLRIEVMHEIDGVSYDDCSARALIVELGKITVPVICHESSAPRTPTTCCACWRPPRSGCAPAPPSSS